MIGMASFARDPERFSAAAEGVSGSSAGEDAREPARRSSFPRSRNIWKLPRFLDGFRRQVVGKGTYLHPEEVSGYALRYFTLRTKRNYVRFANSVTAFQQMVNSNDIVILAFWFAFGELRNSVR